MIDMSIKYFLRKWEKLKQDLEESNTVVKEEGVI